MPSVNTNTARNTGSVGVCAIARGAMAETSSRAPAAAAKMRAGRREWDLGSIGRWLVDSGVIAGSPGAFTFLANMRIGAVQHRGNVPDHYNRLDPHSGKRSGAAVVGQSDWGRGFCAAPGLPARLPLHRQ